jgi:hypothetical protein
VGWGIVPALTGGAETSSRKSKTPPSFAKCAKQGWGTPEANFPSRRDPHLSGPGAARLVWMVAILAAMVIAVNAKRPELTVEELKARIASASVPDRARLCLEIAQKQTDETDKQYAAGELEKGKAALSDVVTYAELARDYSIQSHKYQKQTEIGVRGMTRKLTALEHSLGQEDQPPIKDALTRLDRVRDDLLASMFKKEPK